MRSAFYISPKITIACVTVIAAAALVVNAHYVFSPTGPAHATGINAAQSGPAPESMQAELLTIRPTGFEPAEITRPRGRFLLAVENRSGLEEVALRLDREAGDRLHEVRVHHSKLDWSGVIDPPPGRYVLTEAGHPDWVCHITITP